MASRMCYSPWNVVFPLKADEYLPKEKEKRTQFILVILGTLVVLGLIGFTLIQPVPDPVRNSQNHE